MKKEEKELLLKDLCARLPYGVKALCENEIVFIKACIDDNVYVKFDGASIVVDMLVDEVKPYLFPLSSMTEEQEKEFDQLLELELKAINDEIDHIQATAFEVDFYNKHHFDYRGLIEKGLAIDATGLSIYKED